MNFQQVYRKANRLSGGGLAILKSTFDTFSKTRAAQAAAGLAYYAIFSLFPLLLFIVIGGSYFLNSEQVIQEVTQWVAEAIPVSPQLINENINQVLEARGTVGVLSSLTLLWAALGVFTSLAYNINLAWPGADRRNYLEKRLVGLGMIAGLSGLLALSMALEWVSSLLQLFGLADASLIPPVVLRLASNLISWFSVFMLLLGVYRWVPTVRVGWKATFWGALSASLGWKLATEGFRWYLGSGLGRYRLVYGSLGAIVALLFMIYLIAMVTLFGAHLSAAIDRR